MARKEWRPRAQPVAVRSADRATWSDLQLVFGTRGPASRCWCQRFKLAPKESFGSVPADDRAHRLREQTDCDHPGAPTGGDPAASRLDSGLIFHSWTGHYVFLWQTRKAWAGTCRTLVLSLRDGEVARLTVSFRSGWRWHH